MTRRNARWDVRGALLISTPQPNHRQKFDARPLSSRGVKFRFRRTGAVRQASMVGWAFYPSETARANTENARDRIESGSSTGALAGLVAEDSTTFPSCRVLYSDRSTRRINRGRETMRDDPWTAANRDKEQLKVTIRPTRRQTAETASPPSKPTVSGPFWTGKKSVPDVPNPQGVIAARQRTDD